MQLNMVKNRDVAGVLLLQQTWTRFGNSS